jgi:hypothetical protein
MFTRSGVDSARETVDAATPHIAAMSWMVAGRSVPAACVAMALLSERNDGML